jgi:hypothetical protein
MHTIDTGADTSVAPHLSIPALIAIAPALPPDSLGGWIDAWQLPAPLRSGRALDHEQRQLVLALVEHSAWVADILDHLDTGKALPPHDDDGEPCRLKRWLERALDGGRYDPRMLQQGSSLHQQLHDLADALVGLRTVASTGQLRVLSDRLAATRDVLIELLSDLLAQPGQAGAA